jgi:pyruvate dehydrogenase E1 component alpha subunit
LSKIEKGIMQELFKMICHNRYFQEKLKETGLGAYFDIGEEAINIGSMAAIGREDYVNIYFRGEGVALRVKGVVSIEDQMAWWMGRKGKKNPVTNVVPTGWIDLSHGLIGTTSSCLGGDIDVSVGVALAQKFQKTGRIVMLLIGEGATSKGNFHESLNFASILKLPFIIVVRNNGWAMSTPIEQNLAVSHVSDMAGFYNMPFALTDGNDVTAVYDEVKKAAEWARNGKGPYMVEAMTYRMGGHSSRDEDDYRSIDVLNKWKEKDPLVKAEKYMRQTGYSAEEIEAIKSNARQEVQEAYERSAGLPKQDINEVLTIHKSIVNHMWGRQ